MPRTVRRLRRMLSRMGEEVQTLSDAGLAAKVIGWALVLPAMKHAVPVRSLALVMHQRPRAAVRDANRERQIITFARWAARITRWKSGGNCLERGLIAYRYLCAAGARPTLVVGIGRSDGGVTGHAWVLVDGQLVGEPTTAIEAYTPLFAFDPDGRLDAESPGSVQKVPASASAR